MNHRSIILAATALCALASPALAADATIRPFAGLRVGMLLFDATVQAGEIKLVDQGGDAPEISAYAGADYRWPAGWFVGFEGVVGTSAGRSRLVLGGIDYTTSIPLYTEAAARVGWQTHGGAAFYARAGGMFAEVREGPSRGWRAAPLVGIGAEVPIARGFFARIDASWSDLDGLEVWRASAGIGYRFGGSAR